MISSSTTVIKVRRTGAVWIEAMVKSVAKEKDVVVNLEDMKIIRSATVSAFLLLRKRLACNGRRLMLASVRPAVRAVLEAHCREFEFYQPNYHYHN